jgi:N-methylhydantoinase A/oxoprolinase/acetone carboxylase beta subunit
MRVGTDIGGTFTDLVAVGEQGSAIDDSFISRRYEREDGV